MRIGARRRRRNPLSIAGTVICRRPSLPAGRCNLETRSMASGFRLTPVAYAPLCHQPTPLQTIAGRLNRPAVVYLTAADFALSPAHNLPERRLPRTSLPFALRQACLTFGISHGSTSIQPATSSALRFATATGAWRHVKGWMPFLPQGDASGGSNMQDVHDPARYLANKGLYVRTFGPSHAVIGVRVPAFRDDERKSNRPVFPGLSILSDVTLKMRLSTSRI